MRLLLSPIRRSFPARRPAVFARIRSPWLIIVGIVVLTTVVLIPTLIALPPDDEELWIVIAPTVYHAREVFSGIYPFWQPGVLFGGPEPGSETLIFHPFLVLVRVLPLGTALGIFYELQFLIGAFSVWAVARHLQIRRTISALCVLTFLLSSPTITYMRDLWLSSVVLWTLAPLLLLLILKLLDAEHSRARAIYAVAAGLCAALMLVDSHPGWVIDCAIAFVAFLAARFQRVRELWRWFAVSLTILLLAGASRVYDLALETSRSQGAHHQEPLKLSIWRVFFYPIGSGFREHHNAYRNLALGGPIAVLAIIGFFWWGVSNRHASGLRAGAYASLVLWYIPLSWIVIRSGSIVAGNPLVIFSIFLAALTLQALWERFSPLRPALVAAAGLQIAALVTGFYPFYTANFQRAIDYLNGKPALTLHHTFENQPIYRFFERRPGIDDTRVYMAPQAESRLYRALETRDWKHPGISGDYEFAAWSLHGLRLVNGEVRGVDASELQPPEMVLHGAIRAEPTLPKDDTALDALNIGYVLAGPGEPVAASLVRIQTFHLSNPTATVEAYRNDGAWGDAAVLDTRAKGIAGLVARTGCNLRGLLCADFTAVARLRIAEGVAGQSWSGTDLHLTLTPQPLSTVLMVSQLYRPGWEAQLSNGRTAQGYRLIGGFTGFDLPPGTRSATVSFSPTGRIVLTAVTWATLFGSLVALVALTFASRKGRRAPRPATAGSKLRAADHR